MSLVVGCAAHATNIVRDEVVVADLVSPATVGHLGESLWESMGEKLGESLGEPLFLCISLASCV